MLSWPMLLQYSEKQETRRPTLSQLLICVRAQQATAYLNADDTYLVVPTANSSTRCQEIEQIGVWAAQNNLKLNSGKTKEMVIRGRGKRGMSANLPAPYPGNSPNVKYSIIW